MRHYCVCTLTAAADIAQPHTKAARSMHRVPAAGAVQRHTSSQKALRTANVGESSDGAGGGGEVRAAMALKALLCSAPRAPLTKLPLVAEMPRRMVPAGDSNAFDASMRMTRACIGAAAMTTSQMKHCIKMMCCAPQAKKICTRK